MNPDYEKHMEIHKNTSVKASKEKDVTDRISKKLKYNRQRFLEDNPDEAYKDFELTCQNQECGRTFIRRLKIRHFKENYRVPKFCCQEHANSHVHDKDERLRISESVSKEHVHTCPNCGNDFMHRGTSIHQTLCDKCFLEKYGYERGTKHRRSRKMGCSRKIRHIRQIDDSKRPQPRVSALHKTSCPNCGKEIWTKTDYDAYCYDCCDKLKKYHHRLYDSNGKRLVSKKTKALLKKIQQERIKSGTHNGWKSRNIISYPEKFWMKVLENNKISFIHEKPESRYFLDFFIQKDNLKIDLEIDGKQHTYADRKRSDKIRDKVLRKAGYLVYRVKWNEINSKFGSIRMKCKINQFLWWFNHQ